MNRFAISTILAGILWGMISIFLKPLAASGLTSLQILTLRGILSALMLFIFLLFKDKSLLKISLKDIWMFIGTGVISLTFFSLCYFYTILQSGASIAVVLLYTSPIFVLLFSSILFKEKITGKKIFALILTFLGCIFVSGMIGGINALSSKGILIGVCSGLGYALYSIFSRYALKKYDSLTVTFYTFVFSGVSLIPFVHIEQLPAVLSGSFYISICAVLIALLCTVLPYILYTYGLVGLETGKAAILVTVEPLIGTLIGCFVWKEQISLFQWIGIVLIFASVIILSRKD